MEKQRRVAIKKIFLSALGIGGLGFWANARTSNVSSDGEKEVSDVVNGQNGPIFSSYTKHKGTVYLSGIGAHFEGDITAHTEHVLDELEKTLKAAGSSMNKVLKVSVFLNDINDYDGMNKVYSGRFSDKPPVRTTVAVAKGGVPGNSLVEIDCIAYT
ncbi:MAG: RidA family protein [Ginsengibacter sp.]